MLGAAWSSVQLVSVGWLVTSSKDLAFVSEAIYCVLTVLLSYMTQKPQDPMHISLLDYKDLCKYIFMQTLSWN